jgi:hypothetical protein
MMQVWADHLDQLTFVACFHTTVYSNPSSVRGHPNLFMKLAKVIRDHGAPHPKIKEEAD